MPGADVQAVADRHCSMALVMTEQCVDAAAAQLWCWQDLRRVLSSGMPTVQCIPGL